jgi:beta-glucosidase
VLSNGSPVEMPWVNDVAAILEGYLGGQAGAGGVADILTGRVNPSGKLAETFPVKLEDSPSNPFPGGPALVEYREGIYVGYRYYDTVKQNVLFPFGHGLSYTRFEYRQIDAKQTQASEKEAMVVTFKVRNVGNVAGKEIVQLYVRDLESTAFRPEKELKGFAKVDLQPGEEKDVTITLGRRAFAFYDVGCRDWIVEAGDFEILVGASSRDIRLATTVRVDSVQGAASPADREKLAVYYNFPKGAKVSQKEFASLLGHPVPQNEGPQPGSYTLNTPIGEMRGTMIGRQLFNTLSKRLKDMIKGKEDTPTGRMMNAMIDQMPLRSMLMMGGPMNRPKLEALLLMINGHIFQGLSAFLKASRQK